MSLSLFISIISALFSVVLALFVYLRNSSRPLNIYLTLLIFFLGLYPIFNALTLSASTSEEALFWSKFIIFSSVPAGPLFYFFVKVFPNGSFVFSRRKQGFILVWVLMNMLLGFSGLIFANVEIIDSAPSIQPGPAIPSFAVLQFVTIVAAIYNLVKKFRSSRGLLKLQLRYITFGISISFGLMLLSTVIIPQVFQFNSFISLSPLFLLSASASVAYSILRYRLLEIRAVIARSFAYALSLGSIGAIGGVIAFGILGRIEEADISNLQRSLLFVALSFVNVFVFLPLKSFFDKVTSRIFFKDAYDSQEVIDDLSAFLATENSISEIMQYTSQMLSATFKVEGVRFVVFDKEGTVLKDMEVGDSPPRQIAMPKLEKFSKSLLVRDDFQDAHMQSTFERLGVEVMFRLETVERVVGAVMLGQKQNGSAFSKQDLNLLSIAEKELAIAVQNSIYFVEVQAFNETLQEKVESATRKLKRSNAKLKALDEAKDEFISMASHQLRTPLTSIKGYISMVVDGDVGKVNDKQVELLNEAFASSQRMVYLIADLLNVSRLRTGKFVINRTLMNLPDAVQSEVDSLKETAKARKMKLVYKKPQNFPVVELDDTKIHQVLMNFIDNAIYYSRPGGTITIELLNKRDAIEYRVNDQGIGVPKSEQHKLFTKFYRAGNARKARPDGTGLGLFMAQKVIAAQGGAVIFSSKEGVGSTFGFRFPKAKVLPKIKKAAAKKSTS